MRFGKTGRGYHRKEVDRFKRRIAAALLAIERNLDEDLGLTSEEIDTVTFAMTLGGYDYEEVDAFLARAARIVRAYEAVVDNSPPRPQPTLIGAQEVRESVFTTVMRGYHIRQVDQYLERVVQSLDAYEQGVGSPLVDAQSVARKLFDVAMRGYAEQQVDAVLDRAAKTLAFHENQRRIRRSSAL